MTRVLVIDDEAPIRLLCRVNLEAEGMEVLEASDGPTGLEKARNDEPDVILLDVMMPGLDGWQVAEELIDGETTSAIPIVFLTARAEARDRARGLDLGGIDYVTKPFNPVELAPLVRELIERVDRGEREDVRREKIAELRDKARGLDVGGIDYVTKPFNPIELASLVRDLLERVARGERDALRREKLTELRTGLGD